MARGELLRSTNAAAEGTQSTLLSTLVCAVLTNRVERAPAARVTAYSRSTWYDKPPSVAMPNQENSLRRG